MLQMYRVLQVGMMLHCRIMRMNVEKFQVDLTSRTSDLADAGYKWRWVVILLQVLAGFATRTKVSAVEVVLGRRYCVCVWCRLPRDQYYDHEAEDRETKKDEDKRKKLSSSQSWLIVAVFR